MLIRAFSRARCFLLTAVVGLLAAGCGASATAVPVPTVGVSLDTGLPEANANSVFAHLQQVNYQENWPLWPDKGELYQGSEPHGMLLTTYLNSTAQNALNGDADSFPNGSIIVKENYTPDGVLDATTVMYKVDGYDAEHSDWFWAKVLADGTVESEGKVQGCQACHMARQDNDYIWTSPLN